MKKLLPVFIALLFSFASYAQEDALRKEIDALQESLSNAVEQNDVFTLGKYLHPHFYVHMVSGPFTPKDSLLSNFQQGGNPYKVFRPKNGTFILIDKSTIITSGNEVFQQKEGKYADKNHHREFYHVWKKEKGQWMLAGRNVVVID